MSNHIACEKFIDKSIHKTKCLRIDFIPVVIDKDKALWNDLICDELVDKMQNIKGEDIYPCLKSCSVNTEDGTFELFLKIPIDLDEEGQKFLK